MVKLEFSEKEADMLKDIMTSYLSDLRMEIVDTDSMDFRLGLKARESFIKDFLVRIESFEKAA
jgi:hypothetical protein